VENFLCAKEKSFNKKRFGEEIVKCAESNCCGVGAVMFILFDAAGGKKISYRG